MPKISVPDLRPAVVGEFNDQGQPSPDDGAVDATAQVCVGWLRNANPWPFTVDQARGQVIAYFVQCHQSRWTPEYPTTGNLPALISHGFNERSAPRPAQAIVDALVAIAVGMLRQPSLPKPKPAPSYIADHVVSFYLAGA